MSSYFQNSTVAKIATVILIAMASGIAMVLLGSPDIGFLGIIVALLAAQAMRTGWTSFKANPPECGVLTKDGQIIHDINGEAMLVTGNVILAPTCSIDAVRIPLSVMVWEFAVEALPVEPATAAQIRPVKGRAVLDVRVDLEHVASFIRTGCDFELIKLMVTKALQREVQKAVLRANDSRGMTSQEIRQKDELISKHLLRSLHEATGEDALKKKLRDTGIECTDIQVYFAPASPGRTEKPKPIR